MAKDLFAWKVSHKQTCNMCGNELKTTSPKLICSSCNRHMNMRNPQINRDNAK